MVKARQKKAQKNAQAKKPLVSVIVTNFNGKKYLKECFSTLKKQTYKNIELIMADDCSTDDSVEYMRKNFPEVALVVAKVNSGLAINSNNGAEKARGKHLLFFNNDTKSFPDFIEKMVETAEKDKKCAVVCPVQLPYRPEEEKKLIDDQKDIGVGSDIYGYVCTAKHAGTIFYPDAAVFIRKDVFEEIGKFDPKFRLYGEDMDLCHRVHLLGYKVCVSKEAKFRHDSFCSQMNEDNSFVSSYKRRHLVERQVINKMLKYYKFSTLIWLFPKFLVLYTLEALFFLLIKLDGKMFWDVYVMSMWWNLQNIQDTLKNRAFVQKVRRVDDKYMFSLMYPRYRKFDAVKRFGIPVFK